MSQHDPKAGRGHLLAMQYGFTLPGDYDMSAIERRVSEKGPLIDGFPGLVFKAFLSASRTDEAVASADNLYTPLYVWAEPAAVADVLAGPVFEGVSAQFGRPSVDVWLPWGIRVGQALHEARFAWRERAEIPPQADLSAIRRDAERWVEAAMAEGALAAVAGYDPTQWREIRFLLLRALPEQKERAGATSQVYRVGYVGQGNAAQDSAVQAL